MTWQAQTSRGSPLTQHQDKVCHSLLSEKSHLASLFFVDLLSAVDSDHELLKCSGGKITDNLCSVFCAFLTSVFQEKTDTWPSVTDICSKIQQHIGANFNHVSRQSDFLSSPHLCCLGIWTLLKVAVKFWFTQIQILHCHKVCCLLFACCYA